MTSYQLTALGEPLQRVERETPRPEGSEVLLRVLACGVCHSDVHLAAGYFDLGGGRRMDLSDGLRLPRTLGHEIVGEVVAVGPDAEARVGDRKLIYPWIGCGHCATCASGDEHLCSRTQTLGLARDGGFSDYVIVPHPRYLLDFSVRPELAATYACAGLTAFSALRKAAPVSAARPLLIVGAGGVGGAAIRLAQSMYGVRPAVADIDETKRENSLRNGASLALDPRDEAALKAARAETEGGFATAIDFVGSQSSVEFALSAVRKGGKIVIVGLYGGALQIALPLIPLRAISIVGSYVGSLTELRDLLALAASGSAPEIQIETRPLMDAQDALEGLQNGRVLGRTVLLAQAGAATR